MKTIGITTEYIKLEQFLKFASIIGTGGEARSFISANDIYVNGEMEKRRGRKLRPGDTVKLNQELYKIVQAGEEK